LGTMHCQSVIFGCHAHACVGVRISLTFEDTLTPSRGRGTQPEYLRWTGH
jgi:hypothetical protein